ncbi:hypothetical protein [Streptomyces fragilis]|uniref:Phasin domain-containing protein n=1 Tax=Streptomyces fragilis TaxID=67301 RepID=A0ABV2YC93_9ACTN|nr:hypothetical protein [Streptomyces fragilis]
MSVRDKPSTQDQRLADVFGAPVDELYTQAVGPKAAPALTRALELRSFLALAEEQVARIRDRVHATTAPDRDMSTLSSDTLRMDAHWMEAAISARNGYLSALDNLLHAMPPHPRPTPAVRTARQTPSTSPQPPAPSHAGEGPAPARRS